MSDLNFVLNIPLVLGDNAAEIEERIKDEARNFFGPDVKLALPTGYTAKPVSATDAFNNRKAYEVRDLSVRRAGSSSQDTLLRTLELSDVRGGNAAEIKTEIDRRVREFFGSDHEVRVGGGSPGALEASAPEGNKLGSEGKRVYCVKRVVAQQSGRWSTD
ncbi:hypothetical protein E1281_07540 [Actinomadura sp. KC345]|uniref:hypothetical protein n=1 Tax=Actinomadura sp. KC345 TaxID=2530371 RepID=UPI001051155E|nr:hypothetical protein [Actinomadura sp. KC345]TDC56430.1 hypothetical protein E1281_07540 [Actinomadura sp. KC345]